MKKRPIGKEEERERGGGGAAIERQKRDATARYTEISIFLPILPINRKSIKFPIPFPVNPCYLVHSSLLINLNFGVWNSFYQDIYYSSIEAFIKTFTIPQ